MSTMIAPTVEPSSQSGVGEESGHRAGVVSLADRFERRKWAIVATLAVLVTGMAFMLEWGPVVLHAPVWMTGNDLWGIFRGAHFVAWGYLGGVYTSPNGVLAFPGMEILLAPVAMLSTSFHLSESYVLYPIPRPTAALILQPVELLLSGTVIFAADALAERLEISRGRRISLCFAVAPVAFAVSAIWGHAEDTLATAFAVYAMIALIDRKWARCGWLLGFGIVMQPLVALLLPLFIGATPTGRRLMLTFRSAALSAVLAGIALIGNPGEAFTALVEQPTPLDPNHPTPWAALAPRVASPPIPTGGVTIFRRNTGFAMSTIQGTLHKAVVVSGGAGRIIDVVLAVVVGLYVWRRPQNPVRLLWLCALVLASRCFFEPVMTPYYLAPPLFLILVMAARMDRRRFWAAVAITGELTLFSYYHFGPWQWWLPIAAGLSVMLVLAYGPRVIEGSAATPLLGSVPDGMPQNELDEPKQELQAVH